MTSGVETVFSIELKIDAPATYIQERKGMQTEFWWKG
jgi:hypothetical protein